MSITRYQPAKRMSKIVVNGAVAYLAGQVANENLDADIKGQTATVLSKIDALLAQAGTDKSRILQAQIFLTDIKDAAGMNEVWDAWVSPDGSPARATVQAALNSPKYLIEILVTAEVDGRLGQPAR